MHRENMRWPKSSKSPKRQATVWFAADADPDFEVMGRSFNAVCVSVPADAEAEPVLQDLMTRVGAGRAVLSKTVAAGRPVIVVAVGESDWHADSLKLWTMKEATRLVMAWLATRLPSVRDDLLVAVLDADRFFAGDGVDPFDFPPPNTLPPAPKEPACT